MLESWYKDFVLGVRSLRKSPVFTLTAILTLGIGIGANTAIFTLLYGLVLRSLPVPHAGQLAQVGIASAADPQGDRASFIPYRMLEQFQHDQHSFSAIGAWDNEDPLIRDHDGVLRDYPSGLVSGNAFQVLGVRPYLGRLIAPYDDVRGGPSTGWPVVLSYGFWNEKYGADRSIIGKHIAIAGLRFSLTGQFDATIIGVTPPDFKGVWPGSEMKMYLPIHVLTGLGTPGALDAPDSFVACNAIGSLRPGTSLRQANAEVSLLQRDYLRRFIPAKFQHSPYFEKSHLKVDSARSGVPSYLVDVYSNPLYLIQALVGVVLLLCCVNVGGLMMSKVYARSREFAVRTALGARSWRLIRQYLTESLAIAIAGSCVGAFLAWYGSGALLHFFRTPMMGETLSVHPDTAVFFATGAFALVSTLLFGTLPAWKAGHSDPGQLLKTRSSLGGKRQIAGRAFVPIQVALSLVLVALASLLSQSLIRIRTEPTGFELDHVTIQTAPFDLLTQKGNAKLDVYQRMVDRIDQMPGVRSAAVTFQTPMTEVEITSHFQAFGDGSSPPEDSHMPFNEVGPAYFQTMKTRIIAGREFQRDDRSLDTCIINQAASNYFFPGKAPVGRFIKTMDDKTFPKPVTCRIVGVAEDAKFSDIRKPPPRTLYFPLSPGRMDSEFGNLVFLINSDTKLEAIAGYRKALSEIAPSVPLVLFVSLREQMDAALGSARLMTLLSNFFGVLALLLSAIGLYGLLAASVVQRTGEIGVRMALGAEKQRVLKLILGEAMTLLTWGGLLGAIGLFFTSRFVVSMLHGISPFDPLTLACVVLVLVLVTTGAAVVPALRAASVDPMEALRAE